MSNTSDLIVLFSFVNSSGEKVESFGVQICNKILSCSIQFAVPLSEELTVGEFTVDDG